MSAKDPYCCPGLKFMVSEAGTGISVVVRGGDRLFLSLFAMSRDRSFVAATGMRFCPACGQDTDELIARNHAFFTALAKRHADLLPKGW